MNYTVLALVTAAALIAAAVLAANTPTETSAQQMQVNKFREGPNQNGCDSGDKDEGTPDKCAAVTPDNLDGIIIDQDDPDDPEGD